jgi:hypothetical protein
VVVWRVVQTELISAGLRSIDVRDLVTSRTGMHTHTHSHTLTH